MNAHSGYSALSSDERCWESQVAALGKAGADVSARHVKRLSGYKLRNATQVTKRVFTFLLSVSIHTTPPISSQKRDILIAQKRKRGLLVIAG